MITPCACRREGHGGAGGDGSGIGLDTYLIVYLEVRARNEEHLVAVGLPLSRNPVACSRRLAGLFERLRLHSMLAMQEIERVSFTQRRCFDRKDSELCRESATTLGTSTRTAATGPAPLPPPTIRSKTERDKQQQTAPSPGTTTATNEDFTLSHAANNNVSYDQNIAPPPYRSYYSCAEPRDAPYAPTEQLLVHAGNDARPLPAHASNSLHAVCLAAARLAVGEYCRVESCCV